MRATTLFTIIVLGTTVANAKPPLREVQEINGPLFEVALANEIRKKCPDISGRLVKGYRTLVALKQRARELGYSDAEIDAYTDSDVEKARMRRQGDQWLSKRGVDQNVAADWCRVGREEIKRGSRIGGLLRAN